MIVETLDTGEVVFFLRQALGRMRLNWSDFLADCIRNRTNLHGLQLLPIAKLKLPGDRRKRPRYATAAVTGFILGILEKVPRPPAAARELNKVLIAIDPAMLSLPLEMRHAVPA